MNTPIVIIGAGGFGREVLDIIRALDLEVAGTGEGWDFLGFIDDGTPPQDRLDRIGAKHLGGMDALADLPDGTTYAIGVGTGSVRRDLDQRATDAGLTPATLIDPSATVGADVVFGPGTVVCAGVRVTTNIRTGRHVHLNLNATVGHEAILHDYVTVNPLAAVSGDVTIGEATTVGTTACINQGVSVGAGVMIASGSAVIDDTPDKVLVAGVPAVLKKQF
ncbi:acetyltransferase [Dietzia sp. SLG510A3-30A2]|nr:acetyltransferase [Dietzia sp. SLG510A3-30A2]